MSLLVVIASDWSLSSAELLSSAGVEELDFALATAVQRSTPFSPFAEEPARKITGLKIIRTWQFRR